MSSSSNEVKRRLALDPRSRTNAASKRPKFDLRNPRSLVADAPDETDVFLEVDAGAVGKERGSRGRNRVDVEGYESDSSDEGFDSTRKRWKEKEDDGDGDDMFAEPNDDEGGNDDKATRRKKVEFTELQEIEGEDLDSKRENAVIIDENKGEEDSEDADEQDIDPEVGQGGKKKGAPKIDAFNMRSEMDEGRFDAAGNFIRKAVEKDAVHDTWLEGVSRKDMKKAKEAMERRETEELQRMKEEDAIATSQVLAELIVCLEKGETILEALARLGTGDKKKKEAKRHSWREKKKAATSKGQDDMEIDSRKGFSKGKEPLDPAEARRKEAIEVITGAADRLLTRGQPEAYDESRESLIRQYRRETGQDWVEPKPSITGHQKEGLWEYRWTDGRDEGNVYGPFEGSAMASWNQHGFFGEGVEFREVGGNWTLVADFE